MTTMTAQEKAKPGSSSPWQVPFYYDDPAGGGVVKVIAEGQSGTFTVAYNVLSPHHTLTDVPFVPYKPVNGHAHGPVRQRRRASSSDHKAASQGAFDITFTASTSSPTTPTTKGHLNGPILCSVYNAADVTVTGPNAGAKSLQDFTVPSVDLEAATAPHFKPSLSPRAATRSSASRISWATQTPDKGDPVTFPIGSFPRRVRRQPGHRPVRAPQPRIGVSSRDGACMVRLAARAGARRMRRRGARIARAPLEGGRVGASIAVHPWRGERGRREPRPGERELPRSDFSRRRARRWTSGASLARCFELPSGLLLVATFRGGEVVLVDPSRYAVVKRSAVCSGPYGLASSRDGGWVAVSCEWDGTVEHLDPVSLARSARPIASGLRRPRALAIVGDDVIVADYVGGLVHDVGPDGGDRTSSLVPASAPYRPALTKMSANLASALLPTFGALYVAHALENNTGDTSEPVASDYGSVANTNPKINPAVTTFGSASPVLYAKYDGGASRLQRARGARRPSEPAISSSPTSRPRTWPSSIRRRRAPTRAPSARFKSASARRASPSTPSGKSPTSTTRSTSPSRGSTSRVTSTRRPPCTPPT